MKTKLAQFEGSYTRPMLEGRQSDTSSYSLLHMYATFLSFVHVPPSSLETIVLWRFVVDHQGTKMTSMGQPRYPDTSEKTSHEHLNLQLIKITRYNADYLNLLV